MKCAVCRKRFTVSKEHVYQASETILIDVIKVYDVVDCPRCGCQKILAVRMPKFVKKGGGHCDD